MQKRNLTSKQIQEAAAQQTSELREMSRNLAFWLDGVHYPSEGQYLEYAVRSYLRRRIPKRFEVSTGFISTLERNNLTPEELQFTRKVSRQFDVLIWDANSFSPLFRADDFVIVMPESVRAIIEVTKCLSTAKAHEDLKKFDDLYELYSPERQRFRPYTAMLAFSSKRRMIDLLRIIEKFYLFDSDIPVPFRYHVARVKGLETRPFAIPGFIDSICVLDQGLIKGRLEIATIDPMRSVVRYIAYANKPTLEDSFGFFERDVLLNLSQSAAQASGDWESSVDVYREFLYTAKADASLIIEDWESVLPSLNVMDKLGSITSQFPSGIKNVSNFFGVDFIDEHPQPTMYVERSSSKIWAFERHSKCMFICGCYSRGSRVKQWRVFNFSKDKRQSFVGDLNIEDNNLSKLLEDLEANAWKDIEMFAELE